MQYNCIIKIEDTEEFYHIINIYHKMFLEINPIFKYRWIQYYKKNNEQLQEYLKFVLKYIQYENITNKSLKSCIYILFMMFIIILSGFLSIIRSARARY